MWQSITALVLVLFGLFAIAQESVQTSTAVLKPHFLLFLPEPFDLHGLKYPGVHEGLTQLDHLVARHRLIAEEAILIDVGQHHVHSLWPQEAVVVRLQGVAPVLHLHLRLQTGNDAFPDEGGSERCPSHAWFWWEKEIGETFRDGKVTYVQIRDKTQNRIKILGTAER